MKVSLKTFLPMSVVGAMALASCESAAVDEYVRTYCKQNDKSAAEYYELQNLPNRIIKMSKLDSTAYRDIFNTTQLAKDSSAVAEFNKIASEYRFVDESFKRVQEFQKQKSIDAGMSMYEHFNLNSYKGLAIRQYLLDRYAYNKFFKEKGLMNDDGVQEKVNKYSSTIETAFE